MISKGCLAHLRRLAGLVGENGPSHSPRLPRRTMATIADFHSESPAASGATISPSLDTHVTTTVYSFPDMEPVRFAYYPHSQLYLPLRRDILHRAVIFEGDATRQGTASTKWRDDVHGSHKKVHPQKGMGKARVGDKQSPIRRGGGVAFGPKPRDFSTGLNKKVYDLAWRTALSYRYRKGELVIVDAMRNLESSQRWYLTQVFRRNGWGKADRRSLLVASNRSGKAGLFTGMESMGAHGSILEVEDVDVKDLLEKGRIIVEQTALERMIKEHSSDLVAPYRTFHTQHVSEALEGQP